MDSWKTARPVWKTKRYGLVSERVEAHSERIRRFRLARMDALPRLKNLEPAARTRPAD